MPIFRKKPARVTAVQFVGGRESYEELKRFVGDILKTWNIHHDWVVLRIKQNDLQLSRGDWVVKEKGKDFYICSSNSFNEDFEPV